MTPEEFELRKNEVMKDGWYYPIVSFPTHAQINNWINNAVEKIAETKTIDVYCSPKGKMLFLKHFWISDFNYLGTRIKIIIDENIKSEVSITPDMEEKFECLFCFDGKGIAYIEITQ